MKIVYIITSLGYGGAEKLLINSCNELIKRNGIQISIIYLKPITDLSYLLDDRIHIYNAKLTNPISTIIRIRGLLKRFRPEIIHTHLGHADLLGLIASWGMNSKIFCTLHNIWYKWNYYDKLIFLLYRIVHKTINPSCHIIGISPAVTKHVSETLKIEKNRISYIPNAIPEHVHYNRSKSRARLGIKEDLFIGLFIGRLRVQKSVDTLIEAAKFLKNTRNIQLWIIGEGEHEEQLRIDSQKDGLSEIVKFLGTTDEPDLYFSASDIFILPSIFEGLPTVILEAFKNKVPVIASNIDGNRDLIVDGKNGYLFKVKESKELARKIMAAKEKRIILKNLGNSGYSDFMKFYTIDKYVDSHLKLYNI